MLKIGSKEEFQPNGGEIMRMITLSREFGSGGRELGKGGNIMSFAPENNGAKKKIIICVSIQRSWRLKNLSPLWLNMQSYG